MGGCLVCSTYGVNKDHTFILQSQELGQVGHITVELLEKSIYLALLDLYNEAFRAFHPLRRDHKITKSAKIDQSVRTSS